MEAFAKELKLLGLPEPTDSGQRSRSSSSSSDSRRDSALKPAVADANVETPKTSKAGKARKEYKHSSAYFNFMQDFRAQNTHKKMPVIEMARRCGAAWQRLSEDERRPYENAAAAIRKLQKGIKKLGAGRVEKARNAARPKKRKAARRNAESD